MDNLKYISEVNYTLHTVRLIDVVPCLLLDFNYEKLYRDIFYPDCTTHTIGFYAGNKDSKWIA